MVNVSEVHVFYVTAVMARSNRASKQLADRVAHRLENMATKLRLGLCITHYMSAQNPGDSILHDGAKY